MKLSDFFYDLPEAHIAKYPLDRRQDSRLLCLDTETGLIKHKQFSDLCQLIHPNDLLVLNNTKVIPARLYGQKDTGGKVEILVEKMLNAQEAWVHCRASKRPKIGQLLLLENKITVKITDDAQGLLKIAIQDSHLWPALSALLDAYGHIPLPPYFNRLENQQDKKRYQTVYAKKAGSVAAPTAGLHFTKALLSNFNTAYITLHIGAGTFQPVRANHIQDHVIHTEYADVPLRTCQKIQATKQAKGNIIAVGTTTVRALETASLASPQGLSIQPFFGETQLFIKPGFQFQCIDAMITNFHLPESTLLMLTCAFGGYQHVMNAYQVAIQENYRFYSYGDAMFLTRNCLQ